MNIDIENLSTASTPTHTNKKPRSTFTFTDKDPPPGRPCKPKKKSNTSNQVKNPYENAPTLTPQQSYINEPPTHILAFQENIQSIPLFTIYMTMSILVNCRHNMVWKTHLTQLFN